MFRVFKTGIEASYSIAATPSFNAEPWSVYSAKQRSTKKLVSVFMFDKKKFENMLVKNGVMMQRNRELLNEIYQILRNQVNNLAKFRHPNILTLIEPLEEHKTSLLFVTEYLTECINNRSVHKDLEDIVIQKGLLQVSQALDFLHNTASAVHLNLEPNSVFINENSDWKLSGFGFLQQQTALEYFINNYDPRMPRFLSIDLNFASPELVMDKHMRVENDLFSLGCLIHFLYNDGETFLHCESLSQYKQEYAKFETRFQQMSANLNAHKQVFRKIPALLNTIYPQLVARHPHDRIAIRDFIDSAYFNNPLIKTMKFLEEFPTKSDDEKTVFLKGLINLLESFPTSIQQQKMLPLMLELLTQKAEVLVDSALKIVFAIGAHMSQLTFQDKVLGTIIKVLDLTEAQVVVLDKIDVLQTKTSPKEFQKVMVPLLEQTLNVAASPVIQEQALEKLSVFLENADFPTIKNNIFPKVCTIFSKTTTLSIKISTINAFGLMITKKAIDKFMVVENLLPLLKNTKTREPMVLLAMLRFYSSCVELLDIEAIVTEIIPRLWALSISNTLSRQQFAMFMDKIKQIERKVEEQHMGSLSRDTSTVPTSVGVPNADTGLNFDSLINKDSIASHKPSEQIIQPVKKPQGAQQPLMALKPSPRTKPTPSIP
ncbi:hypothetical protein BABINDRAFT_26009, partial [Babjeviella inositovora NRRL Y-12698]